MAEKGSNEHIRIFLDYYCNLMTPPEYAVLLTGRWGCGKTWFVKNLLKEEDKKSKFLYVSLNGVQKFDDIEDEFFRQLHPLRSSKAARFARKIARGVISKGINVDIDGDGKSDGSFQISVSPSDLVTKVKIPEDAILVFDDIERCPIPIQSLLGYINQYIEHLEYKAILIANEEEILASIGKEEKAASNYRMIKEKLIGKTLQVEAETEQALDHFIDQMFSTAGKKAAQDNREVIKQVYEKSDYRNLRLLRQSLLDFDRLIKELDHKILSCPPLLTDFLILFLATSIEFKAGKVEIGELQSHIYAYLLSDFSEEKGRPKKSDSVFFKYSSLNIEADLITHDAWEQLLNRGSIPIEAINTSLLNSRHFLDEKTPDWAKLWHVIDLTDEQFDEILPRVKIEWEKRSYADLGVVLHLAGIFFDLSKRSLIEEEIPKLLEDAKSYIDLLSSNGGLLTTPAKRVYSWNFQSHGGLGFTSSSTDSFLQLCKYTIEKKEEALENAKGVKAETLLALIKEDTDKFQRLLTLSNHEDNEFYDIPILKKISPDDFVAKVIGATPKQRRTIAYTLKARYSHSEFNSKLSSELPWLREILQKLEIEAQSRTGKVSGLTLQTLIDPYLKDAIEKLAHINPGPQTTHTTDS